MFIALQISIFQQSMTIVHADVLHIHCIADLHLPAINDKHVHVDVLHVHCIPDPNHVTDKFHLYGLSNLSWNELCFREAKTI